MAEIEVHRGRFRLNRRELQHQVAPMLHRFEASLTRRIANQARADVPVKTGNLGRSIREDTSKFIGPLRITGGVTAHADYALYVEKGTRPHIIRPRNAQALHFFVEGREVFATEVHHPGTRARPFMENATDRIVATDPHIH